MASDIKEAIRRLIYQYSVEGADKVMATQEAVSAATEKTDKASLSLDKSFSNLERRYVSTVRFQEDYQKVQERVNAAVAQNPALQERANAVLAAASDHFEKMAAKASISSLAISVATRAFSSLIGVGAVLGLAVTGIGAAWESFAAAAGKSRTTVSQALEEANRLLAENKKLIDERTSAQDRMFAQNKDVTHVQMLQNEKDLQEKLLAIQRQVATATSEAVGTTALPGAPALEMPQGITEMLAAAQKLQTAIAADKSGLGEFEAEIGRIAAANPDLQQMANIFLKIGQAAGAEIQQALAKTSAGLNEVTTNTQAVALGFASIAQFKFSQLGAEQTADAMERMANYANQLKVAYPDLSTSAAKQLEILNAQLAVAQARTKEEELTAQQYLRQIQLQQQGLSYEDQLKISAAERALAEANIKKQIDAIDASMQGRIDATDKLAEKQREAAKQQQDAAAAQNTITAATEATAAASQDFANGMHQAATYTYQVVDAFNEMLIAFHNQSLADQIDQRLNLMQTQFGNKQYTSSFDPLGITAQKAGLEATYGAENIEPFYTGVGGALAGYRVKQSYLDAQAQAGIGGMDVSSPAAASASLNNVLSLGLQNGLSNVERVINAVTDKGTQASLIQQALGYIQSTQPPGLARTEMINELNDKLTQLISSTDSLNSTMQNALSPFYSQDPRTTHLGFRAGVVGNPDWMAAGASNQTALAAILGPGATAPGMADGGSFIVGGGYSANDNRVAMFPVASGEQVIVNRNRGSGQSGQVIQIDNRTIINGSVNADVFAQMKVSKYQQTQRMRAGLAQAS